MMKFNFEAPMNIEDCFMPMSVRTFVKIEDSFEVGDTIKIRMRANIGNYELSKDYYISSPVIEESDFCEIKESWTNYVEDAVKLVDNLIK